MKLLENKNNELLLVCISPCLCNVFTHMGVFFFFKHTVELYVNEA